MAINYRPDVPARFDIDFLWRDAPTFDPKNPEHLAQAKVHEAATEAKLRQRTTAEWMALFAHQGVPAGEVVFPEDLAENEQARANHYVAEVTHETAGCQVQAAPAAQFSKWPKPVLRGAPSLGRDTDLYLPG